MRGIIQLALAIGITIPSPAPGQVNSTLRPSTDSSTTTGVGSNSTFKNVPASELPVPRSFGPVIVVPEVHERPADERDSRESPAPGNAAPPPAAEVEENPRTMITRDRIESPQH